MNRVKIRNIKKAIYTTAKVIYCIAYMGMIVVTIFLITGRW